MKADSTRLEQYVEAIRRSGLSIYDNIKADYPELWIPTIELEQLLNANMCDISLLGLPLRSRSKVVKEHICRSLGYPIPSSFKKVQPRFPGQFFDTYVQKSNNLQVWNEQLESTRRYVIIRVNLESMIDKIKVVTGDTLVLLDRTGTLTQKYQARLIPRSQVVELVSAEDTKSLRSVVRKNVNLSAEISPANNPRAANLLPISEIFERLQPLVGESFSDVGHDQERTRGMLLHKLVCQRLGYIKYHDDGQFPDIRNQLLEVKLQTSPTIDLGLVNPNSLESLEIPKIDGIQVRYCDVRYALFCAETDGVIVTLTRLYLTTGEEFFARFPQCLGKVLNKKLQIPLPPDFFD